MARREQARAGRVAQALCLNQVGLIPLLRVGTPWYDAQQAGNTVSKDVANDVVPNAESPKPPAAESPKRTTTDQRESAEASRHYYGNMQNSLLQ